MLASEGWPPSDASIREQAKKQINSITAKEERTQQEHGKKCPHSHNSIIFLMEEYDGRAQAQSRIGGPAMRAEKDRRRTHLPIGHPCSPAYLQPPPADGILLRKQEAKRRLPPASQADQAKLPSSPEEESLQEIEPYQSPPFNGAKESVSARRKIPLSPGQHEVPPIISEDVTEGSVWSIANLVEEALTEKLRRLRRERNR